MNKLILPIILALTGCAAQGGSTAQNREGPTYITNTQGQTVAKIYDGRITDTSGQAIGYIRGNSVYAPNGSRIANIRGR